MTAMPAQWVMPARPENAPVRPRSVTMQTPAQTTHVTQQADASINPIRLLVTTVTPVPTMTHAAVAVVTDSALAATTTTHAQATVVISRTAVFSLRWPMAQLAVIQTSAME